MQEFQLDLARGLIFFVPDGEQHYYVALAAEEVATTGNDFKRRAIGLAVAGVFVLLFLVFAGVATMLGLQALINIAVAVF